MIVDGTRLKKIMAFLVALCSLSNNYMQRSMQEKSRGRIYALTYLLYDT